VRVADASSLDVTSAFTVEAWIKPSLLPAAGSFESVVTKPESYSLQFNGPLLEFTIMQNGVRQRLQAPAGSVQAGQIYHVVATYDGTTRRLYLNGAQVASSALAGGPTVTPSDLYMGTWDGVGENFDGTIDEVALYNSALSTSAVSAHYTASFPPTAPPAAPSGLTTTAVSGSRIDLSWLDNSPNETGFVVERSTDSGFSSPTTTTVASGATTWADTGLNPGTPYWYRVKAVNAAGASTYSNTAHVTTVEPLPAAPSSLAGAVQSTSRLTLSWTDNASNETSYVVERGNDSNFGSLQKTVLSASATTWSDTGLTPGTTYWYRVRATNAAGDSGYSNSVSLTTKSLSGGYSTAVVGDAPVSYWRLGDTSGTSALDQRGVMSGTYQGGASQNVSGALAGDGNRAVGLNGSTAYVSVPHATALNVADTLTIEAWVMSQAGFGGDLVSRFCPGERKRFSDAPSKEVPAGVARARSAARVRVGPADQACRR
jgi:hypothetical protein